MRAAGYGFAGVQPLSVQNPFKAERVGAYELPQQVSYIALHNDYSEDFCPTTDIPEDRCGEIAIARLLESKRGHFGPLEHAHMTLLIQMDHNSMVQLRTHRVGLSFDVQSMRYTGHRIERVARGEVPVEEVFYFRPPGVYRDRQGDGYEWSKRQNATLKTLALNAVQDYADLRAQGVTEEHARYVLPTSYLQNVCLTGNIRSWFHLLDVRSKSDAQQEVRWVMELVAHHVKNWIPELYAWYEANRLNRALLAP